MTRRCTNCEREVTVELYSLDGVDDVADLGGLDGLVDGGTFETANIQATVRLSCSCAFVDVSAEGRATTSQDVPSGWAAE